MVGCFSNRFLIRCVQKFPLLLVVIIAAVVVVVCGEGGEGEGEEGERWMGRRVGGGVIFLLSERAAQATK